jgi:chemotaxis response regulator CheB
MLSDPFHIVGIGASAGGQEAMQIFFENLPEQPNAAFVIVTHLQRDYVSKLDVIVSKFTTLPVVRIKQNQLIRNNHIYVMPENQTLEIRNGACILRTRHADAVINKAIDIFFNSLAEDRGSMAIAIVMSGAGNDGSVGVKKIQKCGGVVFTQNAGSAKFSQMPVAAAKADNPEVIGSPKVLAKKVVEFVLEKVGR